MNILLLGSKGRLGSCYKFLFKQKRINFYELNNKSILNNQKKFENFLKNKTNNKNILIINCTGLTDVDICNKNYTLAYKVNTKILETIVDSCKNLKLQTVLVHFSTDQLYNSFKRKKSFEGEINPSNFYSISKYLGELKVSKLKRHIIIRTNFFGKSYNKKRVTYSDYLIKNLKKKFLRIPNNIFFNPILIDDLVKMTNILIKKKIYGTFNIGSRTYMSKYKFAKYLASIKKLPLKNVKSYKSVYEKNKRPLFMVMNTSKFENATKIQLPTLSESLRKLND